MGDLGSGLQRFPEYGKGHPLQYSCLENSMDCILHGVTKSWTRLSNFHFFLGFHYSSVGTEYTWFDSWVRKIHWRRDWLPTPVFLDFPGGLAGKESACNAGDLHSIPGLGRCPGERNGYPLQDSGLENSVDCIDHGVAKSQTRLSDYHFFPDF